MAFVVVLALAVVLVVLQAASDPFEAVPVPGDLPTPELAALDVARAGGLTFFQFHMVTMEVRLPPIRPGDAEGFPFGEELSLSFSAASAAMLGLAVAGGLLFAGGRSVARSAGGPLAAWVLHGAKVGVPYALLAVVLSLVARPELPLPSIPGTPFGDEPITLRASPLSALFWTLLVGILAGALGGLHAARADVRAGPWGERAWGVLAGAWRMAWMGLALSFVGLLVLATVHHEGTTAYFRIVGELGAAGRAWFLLTTALFLPNLAAWVLAGSLGGSAFSVDLFGSSCSLLSYARFPRGLRFPPPEVLPEQFLANPCQVVLSPVDVGTAPPGYFGFLLVPLVAVVLGGVLAARLAGTRSRAEAATAGAAAGAVFGLIVLGLLLMSRLVASVSGFLALVTGGGRFAAGPGVASGFFLALAWGVLGGALGGFLAGPPPLPRPGTTGFEPEAPSGPPGPDAETRPPAPETRP